ncbi:hypothetical protein WN55_05093 [Dufourea novaeangliae]|uniref:Uncharacterized protein n=1 Tax=Dufourea novaeangliae TaxID=178035 RepID=A0A154PNT0_DUFNO|nr:hypothetical protein WN55_05093 [Dufourea novaeangliae]
MSMEERRGERERETRWMERPAAEREMRGGEKERRVAEETVEEKGPRENSVFAGV